jgi:hypothetical protein
LVVLDRWPVAVKGKRDAMVNAAHAIALGILVTAIGQLAWGKQDVTPPEESLLKSAAAAYHDGRLVEAGELYIPGTTSLIPGRSWLWNVSP